MREIASEKGMDKNTSENSGVVVLGSHHSPPVGEPRGIGLSGSFRPGFPSRIIPGLGFLFCAIR